MADVNGYLADSRELSAVILHLAVIRSRSGVHEEMRSVRAHGDSVEIVIERVSRSSQRPPCEPPSTTCVCRCRPAFREQSRPDSSNPEADYRPRTFCRPLRSRNPARCWKCRDHSRCTRGGPIDFRAVDRYDRCRPGWSCRTGSPLSDHNRSESASRSPSSTIGWRCRDEVPREWTVRETVPRLPDRESAQRSETGHRR